MTLTLAGCPIKIDPEITATGTTEPATTSTTTGTTMTTVEDTVVDTVVPPTSTVGMSHECGSVFANNDENCVCLPGYVRCVPNSESTDCCPSDGGEECPDPNSEYENGQCFCEPGYTWCNPDDPLDLSCCAEPGQPTSGSTSEGTTGGLDCPGAVEPPASCDPRSESFFCTNPDSCGPAGSELYFCEGGVWVLDTTLDDTCKLDGYDFAYGCVDDGRNIFTECGVGSGAACEGDAPSCTDASTWAGCKWGKTSEIDCFALCTQTGDDMGATYDFGSCEVQDGVAVCACCDEGDEGCPI